MKIDLYTGPGVKSFSTYPFDRNTLPSYLELIIPTQTHSLNVGIVDSAHRIFPDTDALISDTSEVAIGIRTADCVPVLLNAPDIKKIAAVHAGWKGTLGGILTKTIKLLVQLGADPGQMYASFGPSICGKCYEVDESLAQTFLNAGLEDGVRKEIVINSTAFEGCAPRFFLDLEKINFLYLKEAGLLAQNISGSQICTLHSSCPGYWPSWRKEKGTRERLISVIYFDNFC